MNRVEIRGGLVRDPELRLVGAYSTPLLEMTVAVNGTRYDSQSRSQVVKTTFVSVQVWGHRGEEVMEKYQLAKGDEVYVLGELDQYEQEKADGTKERKTRVTGLLLDVLRSRSTSASTRVSPEAHSGDLWATTATSEPPF